MKFERLSSFGAVATAIALAAFVLGTGAKDVFADTNCAPPPSGLVSWWQADSNALDFTGGNNGTLAGNTTYGTGEVGQGFVFDGSGDAVQVGSATNLQLQDFTIEAWIKRASASVATASGANGGNLFGYGYGGYNFGIYNDGRLNLTKVNFSIVATDTGVVTDTNVHHVAVTKSGTNVVFYVDGVAYGVPSYDPGFTFSTTAVIGAMGDLTRSFWGTIDEVAFYNRALNTNEIQAIYNAGSAGKCTSPQCVIPPSGLVAWWRAESNALDFVGGNNGVEQNVSYTTGEVGQAFSLNNSRIAISDQPVFKLTNSLTIECWIQPLGAGNVVFWRGDNRSGLDPYQISMEGNNRVSFAISSLTASASVDAPLAYNQWWHVAATLDGDSGTMKLYTNGVLAAQTSTTVRPIGNLIDSDHPAVSIGNVNDGQNNFPFYGYIDEVSLYSRALSQSEIQAIYNAGSIGKCAIPVAPSIVSQPANQTVSVGGTATFTAVAGGSVPLSYQWNCNGTNVVGATNATLVLTNIQLVQAGNYELVVTNVAGSVLSSNALLTVNPPPPCATPPSGLVSWWRAEGDALDFVGGNNGTLTNGAGFAGGEVGQAFTFDGVNDYVVVPDSPSLRLTNAITIEAWVYPNSYNDWGGIVCKGNWAGDLAYSLATKSGGYFKLALALGQETVVSASHLPNAWYHVAGTWDGVTAKIYVNGVLENQASFTQPLNMSSGPLYLGVDPPGSVEYYNGLVDEAAVYSRAIDVTEIQAIYNAGSGGKCAVPVAPFIIAQPTNQTVAVGSTATFTAAAGGSVPLNYQWFYNQTNQVIGATNASLIITNVQLVQAGNYAVLVTNVAASVFSSNAVLTVNPPTPPAIITQPANQTVTVGGTATFSVTASGSPPLSYQWLFNGTNLVGATNVSLALTNVQMSQAGNYSVLVTNVAGSALSSNAVLTVNFPTAQVRVLSTNSSATWIITVPVQLVANGNEYAMSFSLNFNSALLNYAGVSLGSGATGASLVLNTNSAGAGQSSAKLGVEIVMPWAATYAPGTQEVAKVTFTVSTVTSSTSTTISFGDLPVVRQLSDGQANALSANYYSGSIYIAAAAALEGDVSPRPNGNKSLTLTDWVLTGRYAARLDYPTNASEFQRADCAPRATLGDGRITVADWVQAGRYADGLDQQTPVGGPTNEVAGSGAGPSPTRWLRVSNTNLTQGQSATFSVSLDAQGNENALGFSLAFDPASLNFVGATLGSDGTGVTLIVNTNQIGAGRVGFVLALPTGASFAANTKEVVKVNLQALLSASGSCSLSFGDLPVPRETADAAANALPTSYLNGAITIQPRSPVLEIALDGENVILSWPLWATNFGLQVADELLPPTVNWTNLVVTPDVTTNGNSVTLPISGEVKFYRLHYP